MSGIDSKEREGGVPFSFSDLETRTANYLARVRAEAERIADETKKEIRALKTKAEQELREGRIALEEFRKQLQTEEQELAQRKESLSRDNFEETRRQGFQKGLVEGTEQGYQDGKKNAEQEYLQKAGVQLQKQFEKEVERCAPLLDSLIQELRNVRQPLLKYWEENILQIAASIAYQTIMRELPNMREIPLDLLREALDLSIGCTSIKIRLAPSDLSAFQEPIDKMLQEFGLLTQAKLEADPKMKPGGCVIEHSLGTLDQRLESRLERIISELS